MESKNIYLSNIEINEAIKLFFSEVKIVGRSQLIKTEDALDRVTYKPVYAAISSPFYNAAAMDGIATKSSLTEEANENNQIILKKNVDYVVVDTGDPIPKDFDAVIMVEDLIKYDENHVKIYSAATPWQNIRPIGEDIIENQLIIPSKHKIRPVDIGAVIAGGVNQIEVYGRPVVGIIPTGTEIVDPGEKLAEGNIIDFNSRVFANQIKEYGGIPRRYPIVKDDYGQIKTAVAKAIEECDLLLINAGSSAGREDYTSAVIGELGQVLVHGIAIKPGKPTILGKIQGKPVLGIPGYPVSAYFVMEYIVKKIVAEFINVELEPKTKTKAVLSKRLMSSLKYHEFVRVKLGCVADKIIAAPLNRGAGVTMSLVNADGILEVPQNIEGIEGGTTVDVTLLRPKRKIKNTILSIGSHDPIMDLLANLLHEQSPFSLASTHVGSFGGILALRNGECHLAPIHLLDSQSGEYNISFIQKYLPKQEICLLKFVKRVQGLIVAKNNPLGIKKIADLCRREIRFVNRQRGSGTRILLDYQLEKLGIMPEQINGYDREDYTHLGVAAKIAAGDADCGLGIYSAAQIMGLEFVPLWNEEYDLALPKENLNLAMIQKIIEVMKLHKFKTEIEKIGGYDTSELCKIIYLGE
ncbi:molybdopterin biosynthesis protein [Bacillota bacterium LX-D]|nr:molybdopterin biosynthesis protein [Bacillota bacterium LX-D]